MFKIMYLNNSFVSPIPHENKEHILVRLSIFITRKKYINILIPSL